MLRKVEGGYYGWHSGAFQPWLDSGLSLGCTRGWHWVVYLPTWSPRLSWPSHCCIYVCHINGPIAMEVELVTHEWLPLRATHDEGMDGLVWASVGWLLSTF